MMKKDLGVKAFLFPMPVLMIATYNDDDSVNVMNMAWGGVCGDNMVALNISEDHKTAKNIKKRQAFTISVADKDHVVEADYLGIDSGNKVSNKFEKTGLTAIKSTRVDAPIVEEFPVTLECKVAEINHDAGGFRVIGEIVNTMVDEKTLDENGKVDPTKLNAILFDTFQYGYYTIGEKVGQAWNSGKKLK
ncbi:MAG: flavin reductase family protein [Erysipelotrichaceae bacterium]|nr:flavin reductase family protein [Erysipelotrichaceae bacterium]